MWAHLSSPKYHLPWKQCTASPAQSHRWPVWPSGFPPAAGGSALTGPASWHVLGKGPRSLGGRVMCMGLLPAPGPLPLAHAQVVPFGHEAGAGGWILPPAGSPPCPCPQEGRGGRLSSCEAGVPSRCLQPGLVAWGSRQCSSRAGPGRPGHARWWGRWLRT